MGKFFIVHGLGSTILKKITAMAGFSPGYKSRVVLAFDQVTIKMGFTLALSTCINSFPLKIEWHSTMLNRSGENSVL